MASQSRFQFLRLWDETDDEVSVGEESSRYVSDEQSLCLGFSEWPNGLIHGKCSFTD